MIVRLDKHCDLDGASNVKLDDSALISQAFFLKQFVPTIISQHSSKYWRAISTFFLVIQDSQLACSYLLDLPPPALRAYDTLATELARFNSKKVFVEIHFYHGPAEYKYQQSIAYQFYQCLTMSSKFHERFQDISLNFTKDVDYVLSEDLKATIKRRERDDLWKNRRAHGKEFTVSAESKATW